jgi:hypothetical protein
MLKNLASFGFSLISIGSVGGLYFYAKARSNFKTYTDLMESEDLRDTTRPTNDNFGVNWGYKADLMIKEKIDSGDLLLVKYDCDKCISLNQMVQCYGNQYFSIDGNYDSVVMVVRNLENLFILEEAGGKVTSTEYSNFIARPFQQEVALRRLKIKGADEEYSMAFAAYLVALRYKLNNQDLTELNATGYDDPRLEKLDTTDLEKVDSQEEFLWKMFAKLKILKPELDGPNMAGFGITDLDNTKPWLFEKGFELDKKIIIRSCSNLDLQSGSK